MDGLYGGDRLRSLCRLGECGLPDLLDLGGRGGDLGGQGGADQGNGHDLVGAAGAVRQLVDAPGVVEDLAVADQGDVVEPGAEGDGDALDLLVGREEDDGAVPVAVMVVELDAGQARRDVGVLLLEAARSAQAAVGCEHLLDGGAAEEVADHALLHAAGQVMLFDCGDRRP
jgi:hypothetical protein